MSELVRAEAGAVSVVQIIEKMAESPSLTKEAVEAIERLVALQERKDAQTRKERFDAALTACQEEMPRIGKHGTVKLGNSGGYNYARLEDVDAQIRAIYLKHGFNVRYDSPMNEEGNKIRLRATFSAHGHSEALEITVPPDSGPGRSAVQAVKSSITAGRRHLLEMFFNLIEVGADEAGYSNAKPISEKEEREIQAALEEIGAKPGTKLREAFNRTFRVTHLSELRADQLTEVWNRIKAQK